MKEPALVIIKPDGMAKGLVGGVFSKFAQANLEIIAMHMVDSNRELVEEHYKHLKNEHFFDSVVNYFLGKFHKQKKLLAVVYYGEDAIKKCRKIAGATNPEEADSLSIRGAYGRITTKGVYENVVHVSSNKTEAKREIMLWFNPDEIKENLYPVKIETIRNYKKRVWK